MNEKKITLERQNDSLTDFSQGFYNVKLQKLKDKIVKSET